MPGYLMHLGATLGCTHAIPALVVPAQARVLVGGLPVSTLDTKMTIAGCPFTIPGPKPQPCVSVKWQMVATRVSVGGKPALLQAAPGPGAAQCMTADQLVNGPPQVGGFQVRVFAT